MRPFDPWCASVTVSSFAGLIFAASNEPRMDGATSWNALNWRSSKPGPATHIRPKRSRTRNTGRLCDSGPGLRPSRNVQGMHPKPGQENFLQLKQRLASQGQSSRMCASAATRHVDCRLSLNRQVYLLHTMRVPEWSEFILRVQRCLKPQKHDFAEGLEKQRRPCCCQDQVRQS